MLSHTHRLRVIYGDTDMMGVVYYANYFRYFEAGRTELLRATGFDYRHMEETGYALPVASASAKYHRSATYDDELILETTVVEVGFSRIKMSYRMTRSRDQEVIATGETVHACVGPGGRLVRLPEELRRRLEVE